MQQKDKGQMLFFIPLGQNIFKSKSMTSLLKNINFLKN